ncbi:hypothetical protein [Moorena sp. SIO3H5]|uniref:hypothetical protein n=1 Tax=Moorena sp. SIO3H5 TaxID=2607834 RepID=UPI0013BB78F6|nr:hypothetical protein [Moorena sp. SIO3H5]NEO69614.1 hypothetical protein [Moorena sp. SIO3H5]
MKLARCQFYARCQCLDAVAHGGNPQDRAASLLRKMPIPQVRPVAPLPTTDNCHEI